MAKPIRATPTLVGEEARKFIKNMIKEEKGPSKNRAKTIHRAKNNAPYFIQFLQ